MGAVFSEPQFLHLANGGVTMQLSPRTALKALGGAAARGQARLTAQPLCVVTLGTLGADPQSLRSPNRAGEGGSLVHQVTPWHPTLASRPPHRRHTGWVTLRRGPSCAGRH